MKRGETSQASGSNEIREVPTGGGVMEVRGGGDGDGGNADGTTTIDDVEDTANHDPTIQVD